MRPFLRALWRGWNFLPPSKWPEDFAEVGTTCIGPLHPPPFLYPYFFSSKRKINTEGMMGDTAVVQRCLKQLCAAWCCSKRCKLQLHSGRTLAAERYEGACGIAIRVLQQSRSMAARGEMEAGFSAVMPVITNIYNIYIFIIVINYKHYKIVINIINIINIIK